MAENNVMNPDNAMMRQSEGQWQKYLALVVYKLKKEHGMASVSITAEDIEEFGEERANILLTHGHVGSIEFKLVTPEQAHLLVMHDRGQAGTA